MMQVREMGEEKRKVKPWDTGCMTGISEKR